MIDECNYDGTCTDKTMLYKAAHFNFSVSDYNESTTVERIFTRARPMSSTPALCSAW